MLVPSEIVLIHIQVMVFAIVLVLLAVNTLADLLFFHFIVDGPRTFSLSLQVFRHRSYRRNPAMTHEDGEEVTSKPDVRLDVVAGGVVDIGLGNLDGVVHKLRMFGNLALFLDFVPVFRELSLLDSEFGLAFLLLLFAACSVLVEGFHECAEVLHAKQGLVVLEMSVLASSNCSSIHRF